MYLSNEDLEILKNIEMYLFNINNYSVSDKEHFIIKASDVKDIKALDLYLKLYGIIEKLINDKEKRNIINSKRISEKRKIDKNYARSKKENKNEIK